jgi:hypothetical protein
MSRTESIFESEYIMLIIHILQYIASLSTKKDTDEILVQILSHPCWQIPRLELWRLSRDIHHARREDRRSWIDQMSQSSISEIRDVANFLRELHNQSHNSRLEDLIDMITGSSNISVDDMDDLPVLDQLQIDVLG